MTTVLNNNNNNNGVTTANNNNNSRLVKVAKGNNLIVKESCRAAINTINSSSLKEKAKILARLDEGGLPSKSSTNKSGSSNLVAVRPNVRNQPLPPLTPAKKRSSLARPVRVHDSFAQPRKLLPVNYAFQTLQKSGNESTYEEDEYKEGGWPIRLRLEQMLELTLPQTKKRTKKKTPMMLMKQQQANKHGACKDTERLLRVFSVNNVDQDTRYNVTRCSVM